MTSHYNNIGFKIESKEEMRDFIPQACEAAEIALEVAQGKYGYWSPGNGVEVWINLDTENNLTQCTPHFAGEGRFRVGVTNFFMDEEYPLEGSFYAMADPSGNDAKTGTCPVVIDIVDFAAASARVNCPQIVTLQVAAFAHELKCYPDDASFKEEQRVKRKKEEESKAKKEGKDEILFSPEFFIPAGLFGVPENEHPCARAVFAGHVQKVEKVVNTFSGRSFYWLLVRTLGGPTLDVVVDPADVEGAPVVNGVIEGDFWLSGRLVE